MRARVRAHPKAASRSPAAQLWCGHRCLASPTTRTFPTSARSANCSLGQWTFGRGMPHERNMADMRARHEATSANILRVTVETSCPRGGDSGHGGRTLVELEDLASTDITVTPLTNNGNGGVRLELGGDT